MYANATRALIGAPNNDQAPLLPPSMDDDFPDDAIVQRVFLLPADPDELTVVLAYLMGELSNAFYAWVSRVTEVRHG